MRGKLEELQRLGNVLHVSSSRNLILKTKITPKLGSKVVDENLKSVGTVADIFGPVSSPYVSVKSAKSNLHTIIGSTLYTIPSNKNRKEKRKRER